ncbi:tyrosine-type recombinase/integrase [Mesorhizobium sp. 1B3]|uniref:tyrosine-type recombinase/integrase n=1 Tax=Mesorhizobium sp. 1B3 TaxID=3243599 RepID=UPI003D9547A7
MRKLTKRTIDNLPPSEAETGTVHWDSELKGFGLRVLPSGRKTFVIKFRAHSGRQRWMKLGTYGPLTVERARELAKVELAKVVEGQDPAAERAEHRQAVTVSQLCDVYMEAANAGLVLGRKGTPKKATTLSTDGSRIHAHIKPLLGHLKAREVKRADIEQFKTGVVTGKTARDKKLGFRSRSMVKGGKGALTRTLGLLGAIFAWGVDNGYVTSNPVRGVRRFADNQKKALLTGQQYHALAEALHVLEQKRDRHGEPMHNLTGIAGVRFIALSGVRRGECQKLLWDEVDAEGTCLAMDETKTGPSLRPLSRAAYAVIDDLDPISDYVFAAGPEEKGYQGLPQLWRTVQKTARQAAIEAAKLRGEEPPAKGPLDGITLHSLRHSFAGVAEELGASIPTIAALLGHRLGGVTGGYILKRVDVMLLDAVNRVGDHIAMMMRGEVPQAQIIQFRPRGRTARRPPAAAALVPQESIAVAHADAA